MKILNRLTIVLMLSVMLSTVSHAQGGFLANIPIVNGLVNENLLVNIPIFGESSLVTIPYIDGVSNIEIKDFPILAGVINGKATDGILPPVATLPIIGGVIAGNSNLLGGGIPLVDPLLTGDLFAVLATGSIPIVGSTPLMNSVLRGGVSSGDIFFIGALQDGALLGSGLPVLSALH